MVQMHREQKKSDKRHKNSSKDQKVKQQQSDQQQQQSTNTKVMTSGNNRLKRVSNNQDWKTQQSHKISKLVDAPISTNWTKLGVTTIDLQETADSSNSQAKNNHAIQQNCFAAVTPK